MKSAQNSSKNNLRNYKIGQVNNNTNRVNSKMKSTRIE